MASRITVGHMEHIFTKFEFSTDDIEPLVQTCMATLSSKMRVADISVKADLVHRPEWLAASDSRRRSGVDPKLGASLLHHPRDLRRFQEGCNPVDAGPGGAGRSPMRPQEVAAQEPGAGQDRMRVAIRGQTGVP